MSDIQKGVLLHSVGDSYAHTRRVGHERGQGKGHGGYHDWDDKFPLDEQRMFSSPLGHAFTGDRGHAPDIISHDPGTYAQYAAGLYELLRTSGANDAAFKNFLTQVGSIPEGDMEEREYLAGYSRDGVRGYAEEFGPGAYAPSDDMNVDPSRPSDEAAMNDLINKVRSALEDPSSPCYCPE